MRDEHVEALGTEASHVGLVGGLLRPPVDAVCAVAPVDRERPAEESEGDTAEFKPRAAWNVCHVIGQPHQIVGLSMFGDGVIVMVAVDEPELDIVGSASRVHSGEEARTFRKVREVAEIADLDATWMMTGHPCVAAVFVRVSTHAVLP